MRMVPGRARTTTKVQWRAIPVQEEKGFNMVAARQEGTSCNASLSLWWLALLVAVPASQGLVGDTYLVERFRERAL